MAKAKMETPSSTKFIGSPRKNKSVASKKWSVFWYLFKLSYAVSTLRASLVAQMVKRLPAMQETWVRFPGSGRPPGEGNGNPLQYPCLENPMVRGAWQSTVHGVAKSWTWLSNFTITITKLRMKKMWFSIFVQIQLCGREQIAWRWYLIGRRECTISFNFLRISFSLFLW